jgi:hexosaminidase
MTVRLFLLAMPVFLAARAFSAPGETGTDLSLIPKPVEVIKREGKFVVTPATSIVYFTGNTSMKPAVDILVEQLRRATGYTLAVRNAEKMPKKNFIFFNYLREEELGTEGYRLEIDSASVEINAHADPGFFYGVQTLLQLLPPAAFSPSPVKDVRWELPSMSVMDKPRFPWRGMHLDVSRHFMPVEFICRYIDLIAMHKMNRFHWHLTDDQGWRIEIKKYPKLTSVGAWRADHPGETWDSSTQQKPGEKATYGGFYTQKEVRDIVTYAAKRNVTIVPEIEMPAHTTAALAAYPQFSCTGGPFTVTIGGVWPITDIFCAGNDSTFFFIQDILSEVMQLFPGEYIHVGGDEADKTNWRACPKCQARVRSEGLNNVGELQSYFIKRIEKFIVKSHRKLIGWDEILEGGLAPEATVMSWRGTEGGIAAAKQNHDVVMTPGSHCYFDYYQGKVGSEPVAIGGYLPLSKVYEFEPVPDALSAAEGKHILGAQGNVWTEYIPTPAHAEYMVLPRMAAMGEVLWSPKEARDWKGFMPRVERQLRRYEAAGYSYARSGYAVSFGVTIDPAKGERRISMTTEIPAETIRYTTDGTDPTATSSLYREPLLVDRSCEVRATTFLNGVPFGVPTGLRALSHKALLKPVTLTRPPDSRYPGRSAYALTDGMSGSLAWADGEWLGFLRDDVEATVDLGSMTELKAIGCGFLQATGPFIFFPTSVIYEVSSDGKTFVEVARVERPVDQEAQKASSETFRREVKDVSGRYVRIRAKSVGSVPPGHHGAGEPAWLFVDEIVVE